MTSSVVEKDVAATAAALDTAAKAVLEQVLVAKSALEKARDSAIVVEGIVEAQGTDLPRIGTLHSISSAAQELLNHVGVGDAVGVSQGENITICVEAAEEIAALVPLVVNAVIEEGDDNV